MLAIRPVRGYIVLIIGIVIFIGIRLITGAAIWESDPRYLHIANELEPQLLIATAFVSAAVVGLGSFRGVLIACAFAIPPIMIYFTFYPLWIVAIMLFMVPILAYAALRSWLPMMKSGS
jgi:hypothetical protein